MGSERLRAHGAGNHKLFTVLTTGRKDGDMPRLNEWDYDGACVPGKMAANEETYSVGVFQWTVKAGSVGRPEHLLMAHEFKRSPVRFRIRASVSQPDFALRAAKAVCERLNKGGYVWFDTAQATVKTEDDIRELVKRLDGNRGQGFQE